MDGPLRSVPDAASSRVRDESVLAPFVAEPARTWAATGADRDRHRRIDGSVVFVDVSGFTKMSERLARLGRVGAEHVTDVINQSFVRLLGEAAARGGMLLKFGGAALLLFFSGPNHELRATAAAWAMRRTLREHGTLTTAAGRVTLRMTAGVHSAPFDFFLVGGSHRELVLAGPAATAAAAVEEGATTGQILVGPRTAAALRPANVGAAVGDAYVLRGTVTAPTFDAETGDPGVDLRQFVPVALREVLTGGANRAEHRRVTIAFIHFDGVDEIVERDGPDAA